MDTAAGLSDIRAYESPKPHLFSASLSSGTPRPSRCSCPRVGGRLVVSSLSHLGSFDRPSTRRCGLGSAQAISRPGKPANGMRMRPHLLSPPGRVSQRRIFDTSSGTRIFSSRLSLAFRWSRFSRLSKPIRAEKAKGNAQYRGSLSRGSHRHGTISLSLW